MEHNLNAGRLDFFHAKIIVHSLAHADQDIDSFLQIPQAQPHGRFVDACRDKAAKISRSVLTGY
jgi:hypothetical protein